jgi:hypothetical protein
MGCPRDEETCPCEPRSFLALPYPECQWVMKIEPGNLFRELAAYSALLGSDVTALYFITVRDALDHRRLRAPPPISVQDCARAVRLIDQAYECAGGLC